MYKSLLILISSFIFCYSYPTDIQSVIDSIKESEGDNMVDSQYIENFDGLLGKLSTYFYNSKSDPQIGYLLFKAYGRFTPDLPRKNKDQNIIDQINKLKQNDVLNRKKVLQTLLHSQDSTNIFTLRLLMEHGNAYLNSDLFDKKYEPHIFRRNIAIKMLQNKNSTLSDTLTYLQFISCNDSTKNEIKIICKNVFMHNTQDATREDGFTTLFAYNFCTSCLKEQIPDEELMGYYMKMSEIEYGIDYRYGTDNLINELRQKMSKNKKK